VWQYSQALDATAHMAGLSGPARVPLRDLHRRIVGLRAYFDSHTTPPGYDPTLRRHGRHQFYDDNEWIGLALLRAHHLVPRHTGYVVRAEELFQLAVSGWDQTPTDPCPGGVFWRRHPRRNRNVVSNAPGAVLGLRIYQLTHNSYYLGWAQRMYAWVHGCLLGSDDLYADHIAPNGEIAGRRWTYNQGTMITAGVLLAQITGQAGYLVQARQTAAASLKLFDPPAPAPRAAGLRRDPRRRPPRTGRQCPRSRIPRVRTPLRRVGLASSTPHRRPGRAARRRVHAPRPGRDGAPVRHPGRLAVGSVGLAGPAHPRLICRRERGGPRLAFSCSSSPPSPTR
jgi:hypothetical protein